MQADVEGKARLLGPSIRATIGKIEETLLAGAPVDRVTTCARVQARSTSRPSRARSCPHFTLTIFPDLSIKHGGGRVDVSADIDRGEARHRARRRAP
ncbi:MAG: hypothetical protein ACRD2N_16875 [Vicinamibacterales bacterium]